ncbi:MAG: 23S rRNA (uracil-5-)-methyltransferase RumA [Bacteroidetes bacterium RIFOXYA12_FULL_35_11]|nr:MAG: 23S rRNA (uracil-5-)-methyltransferase RumA [Bacteroidetes bacterium GWF2_35_48]OFY76274.1 MAG: 23S rRNA (uracil-5-)-methyltransferase RumA [Bacteroidetes bacterium RIFOXYA12_FULL_35_11]HBX52684.1 23S rRNA (uracil(1939)-C(5))-methyltransferase RlmD [Bacteroidales bacterium]
MTRKKNKYPILQHLEIIDVAAEGNAIAKTEDNIIVFVPGVIPGDIVDVQITRKRKSFREGYPVFFHKYSEKRIEPFCPHFGTCGGCKWQNLPYSEQLFYKQKQVTDTLKHIGHIEVSEINPILGSEKQTEYRNKLEFTFSNKRWLNKEDIPENGDFSSIPMNGLGFHIPKMFDKVLDISHCALQKEPSNKIRLAIKKYALENNLSFFDLRKQEGFLRNLIIRSTDGADLMVILVLFYDHPDKEKLLDFIATAFPEITSFFYVINSKANDSIADLTPVLYKGMPHITEKMESLQFKIGPKSFFQTNSQQAYRLYSVTRDFAGLTGNETVYDLYTGTGTIANFIARNAKKVIGIEYIPEAIEDAKENSTLNNILNTTFFAGDMKDLLSDAFIRENGSPDIIILDPPRAGIHENVIKVVLNAAPDKIVYVSCNPATQARDIFLLADKYYIEKVQPVDMFPHTHHVENVVLLMKK